ncbi:MAG: flagellar biosynthesis protein FliQ [Desulfobacterales bacterium]|nr:flagellar biosynthesis protein FliQ [Desulfobacterales bacterium]
MTPEFVVDLARKAIETTLLLAAPMLLAGLVIGLLVSIFQAATQINEQTMTFIPKIVAVLLALLLFSPWLIKIMLAFTNEVFAEIARVGG